MGARFSSEGIGLVEGKGLWTELIVSHTHTHTNSNIEAPTFTVTVFGETVLRR